MKNKTMPNNKKIQQKVLGGIKRTDNIKNREQLRKKLKGLLDKQVAKVNQTIHPSANNTEENKVLFNKKSNKSKASKQKDKDTNSNKLNKEDKINGEDPKTKIHSSVENGGRRKTPIKSNIMSKKNKNPVTTTNGNSKGDGASLKRKLNDKGNHLKKCAKTSDHSQTSDNNFKTKKVKLEKDIPLLTKKVKIPKNKTSDASEEGKQPKIKTKSKSKLSQKSVKRDEYTQGRGPLRPSTPDSEFEADLDSSLCQQRHENKRTIPTDIEKDSSPKATNTEQALIRAKNDFEGSSSDNNEDDASYFKFLFDGKYDDSEETTSFSSNSENEYTEEESEFQYSDEESDLECTSESYDEEQSEDSEYSGDNNWDDRSSDSNDYFHSSCDDDYQPPGKVLEDVYIAQGTAVKYELTTNDVSFDSDTQGAQIIEIPTKIKEREKDSPNNIPLPPVTKENETNSEMDEDNDDSCPELVPIDEDTTDTADSYYSDSSHSCLSNCACDSCDESGNTTNPKKKYNSMTPEVIKGKAEVMDEMESFFDTNSISGAKKNTVESVMEEICSHNYNPMKFKVYTINNEVVNNNSFSRTPSKIYTEEAENPVEVNIENSCFASTQSKDETSQKINDNETNHVNRKAMISPELPSHEELHSRKLPETTEISSPFNKKDKTDAAKPSHQRAPIRTLFFNAINCNQVIVLLKDPLYIYGTVKLKLLAGHLEIFGYNPKRNELLEIFSPRGYSSLKIEPSPSNLNDPLYEKELLSLEPFFIRSDLEEIVEKFDPTKDAIVILERNDRSKKVNMLRKYMVENLFPNMNSIQSDRPFYTSEFLLRCIITPNTDHVLFLNPEWNNIRVQDNSKILIIGGKSVGKSTLVRYLINKNLNKFPKMLLIDLDIGQPEIFVPQTISATTLTVPLLGPGYFLDKQPDKSYLVGHVSIIHSLEIYIKCLKALSEYCNANSDYKGIPWIVNTMGYNKGFGDEIISVICSLLQPSNIVQFESDREINDFDIVMIKDNVKSIEKNIVGDMCNSEFIPQHQLTLIKSFIPRSRYPRNEMTMKPRDMRLAMILSRLSSILIGHAEWMTDVKPFCASIDDLNIIKMGDDQMAKEDLVKTLIGNLVYLCRMESGKAYECFGIGIVRGVDFPLRQIYLLPTIPLDLLASVNCLAICGIPLPSSILLNQGPKVKGVASYVYNTLDEAASMYIKQMYNKPQPFPTGKRKSSVK